MNSVVLASVLLVLIVREEVRCGLLGNLLQGLSPEVSKETTTRASTFDLINPILSLNNERSTNIENTSTTKRVTTADSNIREVDNRLEDPDVKTCPVMMPLKKKRFFTQFQPVRPEIENIHGEEVVYYLDEAPDILCIS